MALLKEADMQRGYTLCNKDLNQVVSIDKTNNKFVWIDIKGTQAINKALCFYDKTEAKNICKRIQTKDAEQFGDLEIVNVARLYNKIL